MERASHLASGDSRAARRHSGPLFDVDRHVHRGRRVAPKPSDARVRPRRRSQDAQDGPRARHHPTCASGVWSTQGQRAPGLPIRRPRSDGHAPFGTSAERHQLFHGQRWPFQHRRQPGGGRRACAVARVVCHGVHQRRDAAPVDHVCQRFQQPHGARQREGNQRLPQHQHDPRPHADVVAGVRRFGLSACP